MNIIIIKYPKAFIRDYNLCLKTQLRHWNQCSFFIKINQSQFVTLACQKSLCTKQIQYSNVGVGL